MFRMPTNGFAESVEKHNCDLERFADWVEASALFLQSQISRSDLVDCLLENNIYRKQEFAHDWIDIVYQELRRRFRLIGARSPVGIDNTRIVALQDWRQHPSYSFCIALSVQIHYRDEIRIADGLRYHVQGRLFERLIEESLRANGWDVVPVGWSHQAAESIEEKVREIATAIGEDQYRGAVETWTEPHAKDSGLDLVAWQAFPDGWSGRPICLMQCASGENWHDKLTSPDLNIWRHLISFATEPRRGLAMPFAPDASLFRRRAQRDGVMLLLDRYRLLRTKPDVEYPSTELSRDLIQWTEARVGSFPQE